MAGTSERVSNPLRRPDYYSALVEYLADPADNRTQAQFAQANGATEAAVASYLHSHRQELFLAAEKSRPSYMPVLRTAVYKALFKNLDKSFNDRQLALKVLGDLVETTKSSLEIKTPDEKRALIAQLMQGLSARMSGHDDALPASPPKDEAGQ